MSITLEAIAWEVIDTVDPGGLMIAWEVIDTVDTGDQWLPQRQSPLRKLTLLILGDQQ